MRKVLIYVLFSIIILFKEVEKRSEKVLYSLLLVLNIAVLPTLLAFLLFTIMEANFGLICFLPFFVMLWDLDKALTRVKFSKDVKILHLQGFSLNQYILAKDYSKFYSRALFLLLFASSSLVLGIRHDFTFSNLMEFLSGFVFFATGLVLRFQLLRTLTVRYSYLSVSLMNYVLAGLVISSIIFHFKWQILHTEHKYVLFAVSYAIYVALFMAIKFPVKHLPLLSIHEIFERQPKRKEKKSFISNHSLAYEVLLLIRNPPVSVSVILFSLSLSFGLLAGFVYLLQNGSLPSEGYGDTLLYVSVMFPALISTTINQPLVSFDLDGKLIQLKRTNPSFIKNKIRNKVNLSLLFNLALFLPFFLISSSVIGSADNMRTYMVILLTYLLLSVAMVTSTILFPYFNWEYFYQVPSAYSKICLVVTSSLFVSLGYMAIVGNNTIAAVIIAFKIICLVMLLFTNHKLWIITIKRNYISFKLFKE